MNTSPTAREVRLRLEGAGSLRSAARATVLTSARPEDENYVDQPLRVSPITKAVTGVGPEFEQTFPANSVTVLRLTRDRR